MSIWLRRPEFIAGLGSAAARLAHTTARERSLFLRGPSKLVQSLLLTIAPTILGLRRRLLARPVRGSPIDGE